MDQITITAQTRMADALAAFPGARRALFKGFHIGGCQSCGFADTDTLEEVARKHDKDVEAIVSHLHAAQEQEARLLIDAAEALTAIRSNGTRLIDLRTPQEFDEDHMEGAELINESFAEEIMAGPRDTRIIMYCRDGVGSLNAVAYMADFGFTRIAAVRGGYAALNEAAR